MVTLEQLTAVAPATPKTILKPLVPAFATALTRLGVTNAREVAMLLTQGSHESAGFTRRVENLNYSTAGLTATWPKRFPAGVAEKYARQPVKIGNRAYADRMGNGDEASGDGGSSAAIPSGRSPGARIARRSPSGWR